MPPSATQPAAQHLPELFLERTMTWCKSPILFSEKAHGASRMEGMNQSERKKAIRQFWQVNNKLGKPFVVKHFVSLGVSWRAVRFWKGLIGVRHLKGEVEVARNY